MLLRLRSLFVMACSVGACIAIPSTVCHAQAEGEPAAAGIPAPVQLVPGILTTIPGEVAEASTFDGPLPMAELIEKLQAAGEFQPQTFPQSETLLDQSRSAILRHPAWTLEFAFKPLRMIEVDVPQPTGVMERKLVWYMVYRVANRGQRIVPKANVDRFGHTTYGVEAQPEPLRWFPSFKLEGLVRTPGTGEFQRKVYLDRVVPAALPEIQRRERPPMALLDSIAMTRQSIPVSADGETNAFWGVAMWTDVDPRIDYFSVFVEGLASEYQMKVTGPNQAEFKFKTLQLNFWRPSDDFEEHESEIRYGVRLVDSPVEQAEILELYGQQEPLDYRWIFR